MSGQPVFSKARALLQNPWIKSLVLTFWRLRYRFSFSHIFHTFWTQNPALFVGLCLLLGSSFAFYPHFLFFLVLAGLCWTRRQKSAAFIGIVCALGATLYTHWQHPLLTLPQEKIAGKGQFHIEQVKPYASFFNRSLLYRGTLIEFEDKSGQHYTNLPCHIYLPLRANRNPADTDYIIEGTLCQKDHYHYVLKPKKNEKWTPLSSGINFAEWRFQMKQALFKHLKAEIKDPHSCTLLYALVSGDVDEKILSLIFGKVGLQHVLGVSGFHFSLLALFAKVFLRFLFPRKVSLCLLIALLSFYYFFLGSAPAIQRAYIAIVLMTLGELSHRSISGLNALGVGLIMGFFSSPLNILDLGFQLSFLCTLALLHIYPLVERLSERLFLKRSHKEALQLPFFHQHAYLMCTCLRSALSLNLAVHFISLPVLLFLFHKFPLMSLAYNLFLPACFSLSLALIFIALFLTPFIPFLAHFLHLLNNAWTSFILTGTSNPPAFFDFSLRTNTLTLPLVILILSLSFFVGILFSTKENA